MAKDLKKTITGGQFLLQSIDNKSIFTREDFSAEHSEIYKMVMDFDRERVLPQKDSLDEFNPDLAKQLLKELGDLGLLGVDIPEEHGGIDLDKITSAIIAEALVHSPSFAVTWSVQTGIGSLPIIWFGTEDQKKKFLPKIASGEMICAYGLTEPSSGSDATQAKTTAILSDDGKHYVLNGEKVFITNGGWAEVFIVFAQVEGNQFSAFIVEKDTDGFTIGREEKKLGMKGSSTAQLVFQDAKVPKENLLYEVGKGATIAFNCLNIGRFKLGCSCLGGAKRAISSSASYAEERKAFGTTISKFDAMKKKIADMSVLTFATDSMIYRTIGLLQNEIDLVDKNSANYFIEVGEAMGKYAIETSMVKVFGSDCSHWVIDQGLQILGGYGFLEEYPLASAYRDDRINQIWEGTNEINRQIVTGFFMKKALTDELPIRESIKDIDSFLKSKVSVNDALLSDEYKTVEAAKKLALLLFDRSVSEYAQDLKNEHQVVEMLSDIFTDVYTAESTILRSQKIAHSKDPSPTTLNIAQVYTTEMVNRILSNADTILRAIYHGEIPNGLTGKLGKFEQRMRLSNDVVELKRGIAEYVFENKEYPY